MCTSTPEERKRDRRTFHQQRSQLIARIASHAVRRVSRWEAAACAARCWFHCMGAHCLLFTGGGSWKTICGFLIFSEALAEADRDERRSSDSSTGGLSAFACGAARTRREKAEERRTLGCGEVHEVAHHLCLLWRTGGRLVLRKVVHGLGDLELVQLLPVLCYPLFPLFLEVSQPALRSRSCRGWFLALRSHRPHAETAAESSGDVAAAFPRCLSFPCCASLVPAAVRADPGKRESETSDATESLARAPETCTRCGSWTG